MQYLLLQDYFATAKTDQVTHFATYYVKENYPHAFQSNDKGSPWIIPLSSNQTSKAIFSKNETTKIKKSAKEFKINKVSIDSSQLEKLLMNNRNFKGMGSIDDLIPNGSGLYCIRVNNINKLPKPFNFFLSDRQHDIIYIGIATTSLKKRFLNQELRARGHGSFFRSIGAILGYLPPKGSLISKANKRNYKFCLSDKQKIIEWLNQNLIVNWIEFNGDFKTLETELINKYRPLFNLTKNPSALKELSNLRKICIQIANEE